MEKKDRYPDNALLDMGFSRDEIRKYSYFLISRFYDLIRNGLFISERYIIFKQHYIDGYSYRDISYHLGRSYNHVRRELSKIKRILSRNAINVFPQIVSLYDDEKRFYLDDVLEENLRPYIKKNPYIVEIEDLGLSVRAYNCLRRAGIQTLGDVRDLGVEGLGKVKNMGTRSINEVISVLREYDISL